MTEFDLSDIEITDDDLREIQEAWDKRLLRLKYPYTFDLIRVLARYPKLKRTIAIDAMWRTRKDAGLPIPKAFEESVQASLQYYCRDSSEFKKRGAPDSEALFCWPKGKGAGVWALIRENAKVWVRQNRESLPNRLLGRSHD